MSEQNNPKLSWKEKLAVFGILGFAGYGFISACSTIIDWVTPKKKQEVIALAEKEQKPFSIRLDAGLEKTFEDTLQKSPKLEEVFHVDGKTGDQKTVNVQYFELKLTDDSLRHALQNLWKSGFLKKNNEVKQAIESNTYWLVKRVENASGRYIPGDQLILFNHESFVDMIHPNRPKFVWMQSPRHQKIFGNHIHELECSLAETIVHELFHDFWYTILNEDERQKFESSMFELYQLREQMSNGISPHVDQAGRSLKNPHIEKLKSTELVINYTGLFFVENYRKIIASEIQSRIPRLRDYSITEKFADKKQELEKEYKELEGIVEYLTKKYRREILDIILKENPDALKGIQTAEAFFYIDDLLGKKLNEYSDIIYKRRNENTNKFFCGVEGFAFMAGMLFEERDLKILPSTLQPFYERFIDFEKAFSEK